MIQTKTVRNEDIQSFSKIAEMVLKESFMKQTLILFILFFTTASWAQLRGGGGEKDLKDKNQKMQIIKVDVHNLSKISKDLFHQCYKQQLKLKDFTDLYVHMTSIQNLHHLEHGKSWDICDKESKKVNWSCLKRNELFKLLVKKIIDSPSFEKYLQTHENGLEPLQAKEMRDYFYKTLSLKKYENRL
jgi:hypothetical protein